MVCPVEPGVQVMVAEVAVLPVTRRFVGVAHVAGIAGKTNGLSDTPFGYTVPPILIEPQVEV